MRGLSAAVLASLTFGASLGVVAAPVEPNTLNLFMQPILSASAGQLVSVERAMDRAQKSQLGRELGEKHIAVMRAAFRSAFAPEAVNADIRASLRQSLSEEDATIALLWMQTDIGKRISDRETAATASLASMTQDEVKRLMGRRLGAERLDALRDVAEAGELSQAFADSVIYGVAGVLGAALPRPGQDVGASLKETVEAMERARPRIVEEADKGAAQLASVVYEGITDAELKTYAKFLRTPEMARVAVSLRSALRQSQYEASIRYGKLLKASLSAKK